ncbi:DUF6767 domain-containing protein [Melissospora conviva]|uniref:DUF6767 domain-containing protein n=1 Tax=Melissospora conviva TaxID=3388432 RepID=UPI003B7CD341
MARTSSGSRPTAKCPVRPGEPCTLCQLDSDVTGPQDCPLVWIVMRDQELRDGVHSKRMEQDPRQLSSPSR